MWHRLQSVMRILHTQSQTEVCATPTDSHPGRVALSGDYYEQNKTVTRVSVGISRGINWRRFYRTNELHRSDSSAATRPDASLGILLAQPCGGRREPRWSLLDYLLSRWRCSGSRSRRVGYRTLWPRQSDRTVGPGRLGNGW